MWLYVVYVCAVPDVLVCGTFSQPNVPQTSTSGTHTHIDNVQQMMHGLADPKLIILARSKVLRAVSTMTQVFWDMMLSYRVGGS